MTRGGLMSARASRSGRVSILLTVFVLLLTGSASVRAGRIQNPRMPAPSPDGGSIAFSYMGDIWVVPASGGLAARVTVHEAYDDHPLWSPDGERIAFNSDRDGNTDIYVIPRAGGEPEQLTFHSSWDALACWEPDGDGILFSSRRDTAVTELFRVSVDGGLPVRVIRDRAYNVAVSPDGRWIAYVRGRTPWWRKHYRGSASRDIWIRAAEGGKHYKIVGWAGDDDRPMWGADGRTLYFQSERADSVANIWKVELELPEAGGIGRPEAGPPSQVTFHARDGVQFASISGSGGMMAYEWDGGLWALELPDGEPREVDVAAPSDLKWNDHLRMTSSSDASEFALSPGESEIAIVVRGEVYVAPFEDGDIGKAKRVTETSAREKGVAWMPDGERLLFASDRGGDYDIYSVRSIDEEEKGLSKALKTELLRLTDSPDDEFGPVPSPDGEAIAYHRGDKYLWTMKADGSEEKQLLPEAEILHFAWSPDGRWIALSRTTLGHKEDIFILDAGDGEAVNVTEHPNDDFQPGWSDDGKRLSYASRTDDGQYTLRYMWLTREDYWKTDEEREEDAEKSEPESGDEEEEGEEEPTPLVVEIDFEGLKERAETVLNMRGGYEFYAATPDGHYFAFPSRTLGGTDLWIVDWKGRRLRQVTEGGSGAESLHWSEDGSTCYYLTRGGTIGSVSIDPESGDIAGRGGAGFSVDLTVDIPEERKQMFNEAWRLLLNGFYDPGFHGVDWEAVREYYEPMALAAYTEEEFRIVVREMLGELSASHLGIYKWGGGGVSTGRLGVRRAESHTGPGLRVREVIPESPAERAGIEPGDHILAIDGSEIRAGENYHRLLADAAGDEILLTVAGGSDGGDARDVRLRPVGGGTMSRLVYDERVERARETVDELSGGRLGYLHIPGMGLSNLVQFEEDLFAHGAGKDGLVIDIRGNGGGSVHDEILRFLDRRVYGYTTSRTRPPSQNPLELFTQPLALLIDESCYSDAEIFPMGWKALDLGPVVGTPTFGAVIGTNDVRLIDGTGFRVPGSGWYSNEGRNLENWGIEPDVRVDAVPEEGARGEDVQLETAVEVLLGEIE
ncbi:MAG: PDZ domain-containing protein [Candidatus Eisenbacteria bacterium]|nr:PDZ domain-containing protein [Candidatus Eisenbacteria bacterium]